MEFTDVLDIFNKRKKYPHIDELLKRHEDVYYGISLHTLGACPWFNIANRRIMPAACYGQRYQDLFDFFLLNRHPRESEETRNWRFSRYKPLTKAPFQTVTELVTGAIFQDGNYTIEIPDQEDSDYIWGNNFHGESLIKYFSGKGYKHMIEDPNGVFIRLPKKAWYDYQASEKIEVDIWFINSCEIKYISETDIVFHNNGYGWHIDRNTIWQYEKTGKEWKLTDARGYYAHMMGKLPITVAGGEWNSKGYYDSFYDKAKAAADVYIDVFSSQQLVDKNASHPFIIESSEDCPTCNGLGTFQNCEKCHYATNKCICDSQEYWNLVNCGSCSGSGKIATDPSRRKIVPADQLKEGQHVQIVSPDIGVNKHHIELCKEIMHSIKEALHLNVIDEAQSGAAKSIDQDRQYKFISKISNHLFDNLIYDSIYDIIAYRHVVASDNGVRPAVYQFKIIKPQQFDIRTAYDLLEDIEKGKNLPKYMIGKSIYDYADKQYSGDDNIKKKTWFINQYDPYANHTYDELVSIKVLGTASQEQLIMHDHIPVIVDAIIREKGDEWFLDAEYEDILAEVNRLKGNYMPQTTALQQQVNESLRINA